MIKVLIDTSYLAYRALHTFKQLTFEEIPTGVIFGFFEQLRTICRSARVNSNRIALFIDSRQSYRRLSYPTYKAKRENRTEEEVQRLILLKDQVKILWSKILPEMGLPVYRQTGLEADDLMAAMAATMKGNQHQGIMITADQDMFQCITEACHWYDPARSVYLYPFSFQANKSIVASQWGEVKALAGCSSDNVAGVPGVGEKTAIKFLKGTLPARFQSFKAIMSVKGKKIIARNRPLVVLPHARTKPIEWCDPKILMDAFFHYCERYGLASYLQKKQRNNWISFFNDPKKRLRKRKK